MSSKLQPPTQQQPRMRSEAASGADEGRARTDNDKDGRESDERVEVPRRQLALQEAEANQSDAVLELGSGSGLG